MIAMLPGLNCTCVNSCSHFNYGYCVLFYYIVWLRLSSINKPDMMMMMMTISHSKITEAIIRLRRYCRVKQKCQKAVGVSQLATWLRICKGSAFWHCSRGRTSFNAAILASPFIIPNSTWLVTSRLDTTRHVRRVEKSRRAYRAVLFQHGVRRTSYSSRLYEFSRFYALTYTNPICSVK